MDPKTQINEKTRSENRCEKRSETWHPRPDAEDCRWALRQPNINKISFGKTTRKKTTCRKPIWKKTKRIAEENYRKNLKKECKKEECKGGVQGRVQGRVQSRQGTRERIQTRSLANGHVRIIKLPMARFRSGPGKVRVHARIRMWLGCKRQSAGDSRPRVPKNMIF